MATAQPTAQPSAVRAHDVRGWISERLPQVGWWTAHMFVLAYCAVLAGGFAVQYGAGEYPCPLCILQRMAMMLAAMGPAYIIAKARHGDVAPSDYMTGYGMSILAAIAGMAMSTRQVLLHISPNDRGYGDPVLGLHLYTWALVTFVVVLAFCGFSMMFGRELAPRGVTYGWVSRITLWLFAAIIVANLLSVFVEEGFHFFLPDDPDRYQLWEDLGFIKKR